MAKEKPAQPNQFQDQLEPVFNSQLEEWPDSLLILALGNYVFEANNKRVSNTLMLKLNLIEIPSSSVFDVKGKSFVEDGVAEFHEGCEGCGNLGFYAFKKNGKQVEFLMSGSDIIDFGSYTQEKEQVYIQGEQRSFTVSSDGTYLTDNKSGTRYNLVLQK